MMLGSNTEERAIYATDGEYTIYPIEEGDREYYIELHRQIYGEASLFLHPLSRDMMWEQVLGGTDKVFSIFDKNREYCGSIELQHPEADTPELGIDLMISKRNKGIAARAIKLTAQRAYDDKKVEYFLIRISSKNLHSRHVFEKMGAIPFRTAENTFQTFMRNFKASMKNADIGSEMEERLKNLFAAADDLEEEVIYEYKLPPEIFCDSVS